VKNDASAVEGLLLPFPAERMKLDAVNPVANNARHEGPDCIEPARRMPKHGART
jgi:hypothetical protein